MKVDFYPFPDVKYLSKRDVLFQSEPQSFKKFLSHPFHIDSFKSKIEERRDFPVERELLVSVIKEQYAQAGISDIPVENIDLLSLENTFTVITAHQPSLLTGPLYFVYKILSVINLAEQLSEKHVQENIVPVFIIGSEDHDFDEVNHLTLFGKKIAWESNQTGPVGRMKTEGLDEVLEEVYSILGESDNAIKLKLTIEKAFKGAETYNIGVFRMVHELFKKYNLVILVTDHKDLKKSFVPHIKKEIFEHISQDLIVQTQNELEELHLKSQAHAREINFFYLQEGRRDRIVLEDDKYAINDTDLTFSKEDLEIEIENYPERFSPNVVMRPIYQEFILPNLAYLGGGGEIAYWTERKRQFEALEVSFPILVRRNSLMFIGQSEAKQLQEFEIDQSILFDDVEEWLKHFLKSHSSAELEFTEEFENFHQAYEKLAFKAEKIDHTLAQAILANQAKQFKIFEQLSGRLLRSEKDKHDREVKKIRKLHHKLFPGGGLQERKDNFIPFYLKYGDTYFDLLKKNLDPFNHSFVVISETE